MLKNCLSGCRSYLRGNWSFQISRAKRKHIPQRVLYIENEIIKVIVLQGIDIKTLVNQIVNTNTKFLYVENSYNQTKTGKACISVFLRTQILQA